MIERTRLSYNDLRVTLHHARFEGDTVAVSVFAGNNADASVDVSFKKSTFWDGAGDRPGFLDLLDTGPITRENLFAVGEQLADIALPTSAVAEGELSVRDQFTQAEATARATETGAVRIRLTVFDPVLAQLPWEYMAIKQSSSGWGERDFLALRRRVSIVRAGPAVAAQPHDTGDRLNITAVLANPGAPFRPLDLGKDRVALDNAAKETGGDGATPVTVRYVSPPTVDRLVPAVDDSTHVFYFGGHGQLEDETTNLILEKVANGTAGDAYSATLLGQLLAGRQVRLAFLGACDTGRLDGSSPWAGAANELMRAEVPFVVAYQAVVLDPAASLTARYVWRYCVSGFAIDQAIADARTEMLHTLRDAPAEWGKVVLYLAEEAGDKVFAVETADEALRLRDVLGDEFAAWLASRTGSAKTTLYSSAIAETTHDLVALEADVDEFEDPSVRDRLASPYRPFKHFTYQQRRLFEREELTAKIAVAFSESRALLVSGPAGSGKTSLLLAGLGPQIVAEGHALIRVAEYVDLPGRLAVDLSDLGLADLPDSADMEAVLNALERDPPPVMPVVILDQLEQLADPGALPTEELNKDIKELIRAARHGLIRLILVIRDGAETYGRGLMLGEPHLDWKPVEVPNLTHDEALAAIRKPPARLEKTIHYLAGIPERIATELNPDNKGVQPGLLAVVCDRLWHDTKERGPEGNWSIDKPAEGGVARVLATALDRFLDEELAGLSDAAQEVLGSADLFEASPWAQLDLTASEDHAQAIERLVQLGLLARRTRTRRVTEYRYSGPAVRDLVLYGQPWTVRRKLDAQDTLESIRLDWKRGLLPSRGHVAYVAAAADQLHPDLDECTLLIRASLTHRLDPTVWVDRAKALSEDGEGNPAVAATDTPGSSISHESERGQLLGVPKGESITPPANVGPYTWWAINGPDRITRLTAGLVASLDDFGGRLNEAAFGQASGDRRSRRRRLRQLWAALDDVGRLDAAEVARLSSLDQARVSLAKARLRISRNRRELGFHSRSVGLPAGLILGLLQMVNWLLLEWPNWTRFTESLGELFEFFFIGGLLGAALGAGMQIPKVLGYDKSRLTFLSGAVAFTVMSILLELSNGREFWRRPTTMLAMAIAGTVIVGAALWPDGQRTDRERLPWWRRYVSASTAVAAAVVAVLHWLIRLPDDVRWKGRLLFAKSRDNYFAVFNQLHDSEAPVDAAQFIVMSLGNTALAGLILAGAARFGRRAAERAAEEIRRTEERVPAENPPA